jgi:signal transduction histidine kinase
VAVTGGRISVLAERLGYRPVERLPGEVRWFVVVGAAFVCTALAVAVPPLRFSMSVAWAFGTVFAIAWRALREAPPAEAVWWRFAVGGGLLVVGLSVRTALATPDDPYPLPSWADVFMLPSYLVLLLAARNSARLRRGAERRRGDHIDAAIVAGTAALVVWSLVVAPVMTDPAIPLVERGFELAYTVIALGFIYFTVVGGLGPGYPSPAHRLLLAFGVFLWVLDAFGADDVAARDFGDLLYLAVPIPASLAAAAALEPSARWAFAGPDPETGERLGLRLAISASLLLVGPAVQVAAQQADDGAGGWVAAVGTVLLAGLIFWRLSDLIRTSRAPASDHAQELERLHDANRLLRGMDVMARDEAAPVDVLAAAEGVGGRATRLLGASVVALVVADNAQGIWMPRLAEGVQLDAVPGAADLPRPLDQVAGNATGVMTLGGHARGVPGPSTPLVAGSRSGIYAPLVSEEAVVGVFAVEHPDADRWGLHDLQLVAGLAEVLAVTVDNARSVRRLQTRGAIEHRHDASRDLHDLFGQVLTTLGLEVDRLRIGGGADAEQLEQLRQSVTAASGEIRAALRTLRPPTLSEAGFPGAAEDLFARLGGSGPELELVVERPGWRAADEVEQQMAGILQEAVTNARRHGRATRVTVRWSVRDDGSVRLEVADDGIGFEPPSQPGGTLGLVGMAERAELLDGRMRVHSAPGEGCRIVVEAPPWEGG